ncbi:unnamed protein product [Heligmosomoides polygyrus]|uniref:Myotubularin phosphatase domain-containing protein n=1 Tax=Heligmosomoides polygyrus TaxID=6339 RepID=A0A3P8G0Q9_HELPZ|nr:unnamed protein product [Heligmosomoides polygyrus]
MFKRIAPIKSASSAGISCVVHCSDGWDRTSQTVSLAQLLLDPFYRTIHGFQVLIEKDWLGFGHKFDDRCAHVGALNDEAAKEVSPVFSQFLDCVHQVMRQRPRAFQFNDRYLIDIHEHVYSCQYGTFIGNCEKDRKVRIRATCARRLVTTFALLGCWDLWRSLRPEEREMCIELFLIGIYLARSSCLRPSVFSGLETITPYSCLPSYR